jgi:hypothetical protein
MDDEENLIDRVVAIVGTFQLEEPWPRVFWLECLRIEARPVNDMDPTAPRSFNIDVSLDGFTIMYLWYPTRFVRWRNRVMVPRALDVLRTGMVLDDLARIYDPPDDSRRSGHDD